MNTAIYIILVAVLATLLSTSMSLYVRDRQVSPVLRGFLWTTFVAGVTALVITIILLNNLQP